MDKAIEGPTAPAGSHLVGQLHRARAQSLEPPATACMHWAYTNAVAHSPVSGNLEWRLSDRKTRRQGALQAGRHSGTGTMEWEQHARRWNIQSKHAAME